MQVFRKCVRAPKLLASRSGVCFQKYPISGLAAIPMFLDRSSEKMFAGWERIRSLKAGNALGHRTHLPGKDCYPDSKKACHYKGNLIPEVIPSRTGQ